MTFLSKRKEVQCSASLVLQRREVDEEPSEEAVDVEMDGDEPVVELVPRVMIPDGAATKIRQGAMQKLLFLILDDLGCEDVNELYDELETERRLGSCRVANDEIEFDPSPTLPMASRD